MFKKTQRRAAAGFTLLELLFVIGIIAILMGITASGYIAYIRHARETRCHDKIVQAEIALSKMKGMTGWPSIIINNVKNNEGLLDENVCRKFTHSSNIFTQTENADHLLRGADRFGIVTVWAETFLEENPKASKTTDIPGGGTVRDHIFRFSVDKEDSPGVCVANVGGVTIKVRKTAIVWCCGANGEFEPYGADGSDDIYSWTDDQVVK